MAVSKVNAGVYDVETDGTGSTYGTVFYDHPHCAAICGTPTRGSIHPRESQRDRGG